MFSLHLPLPSAQLYRPPETKTCSLFEGDQSAKSQSWNPEGSWRQLGSLPGRGLWAGSE